MRVLVVDDEKLIRDVIKEYLLLEKIEVEEASNGEEALNEVKQEDFDIIIMDIMMPKMDGYTACREIKKIKDIPFIMLSARGEEYDKLIGFDLGIDDYVTKPFSVRELMARIKANLRKAELNISSEKTKSEKKDENKNSNKIVVGDLELDLDKFEVKVRGEIIDLTLREFEVLKYLANQPGQVVTRETLLEKVWGYEYYGDIRTVDVTVRRIREKIEKDTSTPQILITKRGVGYYIVSK